MNEFTFDSALEWRLAGTPDMVKLVLKRVASEYQFEGHAFSAGLQPAGIPIIRQGEMINDRAEDAGARDTDVGAHGALLASSAADCA